MAYRITYGQEVLAASNASENAVIDPVLELEANKAGKLTLTMLPGHPLYDTVAIRDRAVIVYLDDLTVPYWAGFVSGISLNLYGEKCVECVGFMALFSDFSVGVWTDSYNPTGWVQRIARTVFGSLVEAENNHYLNDIKLTYKPVPSPYDGEPTISMSVDSMPYSEIINSVIEQAGGVVTWEYSVSNGKPTATIKYIFHTAYDHNESQPVAITYNVVDAKESEDDSELYTQLVPVGAKNANGVHIGIDGRTIDDAAGISRYGKIERIVEFKDVTDKAQLRALGEAYMASRNRSKYYEVSFVDLSFADPVDRIHLLELVNVRMQDGQTATMLVTKLKHNLNHPESDKLTVGTDSTTSMSASVGKLSVTTDKTPAIITGTVVLNDSAPTRHNFATPCTDANYVVILTAQESPADGIATAKVTAKDANGFSATIGGSYNNGGGVTFGYIVAAL